MNRLTDRSILERDRISILSWTGPGLLTDDRLDAMNAPPNETKPLVMARGQHAVAGFYVPFLPEPLAEDSTQSAPADRHRDALLRDLLRMVQGLHLPQLWHDEPWERRVTVRTFDIRFMSRPGKDSPGSLSMFLLVKVFVPTFESRSREVDQSVGCDEVIRTLRLCRAVAPHMLTLQPLCWTEAHGVAPLGRHAMPVTEEEAGISTTFTSIGELRRENYLTESPSDQTYKTFCEALESSPDRDDKRIANLPKPWPTSRHDLLATCGVMAASPAPVLLSVRLQPTLWTRQERGKLARLEQDFRRRLSAQPRETAALKQALDRTVEILASRELFWCAVQVAAHSEETLGEVLTTLAGEHAASALGASAALRERPARVICLHSNERDVARFNLSRLELWPWGAIDGRVLRALRPGGSYPDGSPDLSEFTPPDELRDPETFPQRDLEGDPALVRLRALLSVEEAASLWRIPIVGVGGQAGLVSRPVNPFEQVPIEVPSSADTVSLGFVQHRGVSTGQEYFVSLSGQANEQVGVGDRVLVVAGSPGSGKTNFCLNFLEQLWGNDSKSGRRVPYLVIDPTRGMEFRSLANSISKDLVVFTVGDVREVPFCFNPFIVPANVSLQAHVSRLLSCFKVAYSMWDPLPAIFEAAIRKAYRVKFASRGTTWDPTATFGSGRASDYPTLSDVCDAMGTGSAAETDTVLATQREMWSASGQATENQSTIITSTSLRLLNLRENYEHIIGGPKPGRPCVDITKLLRVPTVLELGMIGDSQTLSLIMAFLVVSMVGCIENRDRRVDPLHLLVIEEAHRLLSAEGDSPREGGSPRAQAVEDINTLLAEVHQYGQGVMLLDQRPGSLVGGVIDNAYLVALHRLNERKSFDQFADTLNLSAEQRRFARVALQPGDAVVLDRPSGIPILVRPPERQKSSSEYDVRALVDRSAALVGNLIYPLRDQIHDEKHLEILGRLSATLAGEVDAPPSIERLSYDLADALGTETTKRDTIAAAIVAQLRLEQSGQTAASAREREPRHDIARH